MYAMSSFIPILLAAGLAALPAAARGVSDEAFGGRASSPDSGWAHNGLQEDLNRRARDRHGMLVNRLEYHAGRLQQGSNPRAFELAERIRGLLSQARLEIEAGRALAAMQLMAQADVFVAELGILAADPYHLSRGPGAQPDLYRDTQRPASAQADLRTAFDLQARVQDHLMRLRDRPGPVDEKALALQRSIQDLLDKSKEALAAGKSEASRELSRKAEALLTDLHLAGGPRPTGDPGRRLEERLQRLSDQMRRQGEGSSAERITGASAQLEQARDALGNGRQEAAEDHLRQAERLLSDPAGHSAGRLSAAGFDRMRAKLEKAAALVKASGDDKAARILEKGQEHFAKAERFRSEGQSARAEAEMDISLKLAAKAVDIARAARR